MDQIPEVLLGNSRRSGVVGVTENEKIITLLQFSAEIRNVRFKIHTFLKVIVFLCASGKRKFSGVFRIGRSKNKGMLRRAFLDQKRDQFTGAVSRKDKISRNIAVAGNGITKRCIISVRVGRKQFYMAGNGLAGSGG